MKAKFTLAALCLLFAGAANAELIKTDYKTTGDELATLDTETGIEWLDISETAGYNLNEISALIAEGGELEGWRMPTQTEVTNLFMMLFDGNISSGENNRKPNRKSARLLWLYFIQRNGKLRPGLRSLPS